jgi:hypothetical protein
VRQRRLSRPAGRPVRFRDRPADRAIAGDGPHARQAFADPPRQVAAAGVVHARVKRNKPANLFAAKDELVVFVKPAKDVHVEMIATGARGHKTVLVPASTKVEAGEQFRFPPEGKKAVVPAVASQEEIAVFASEAPFPTGELLRGSDVADRVVHAFPVRANGKQGEVQFAPDPARTVK